MALHGRFCAQIGHFRDGPMWVNGKTGDRWKKISLLCGAAMGKKQQPSPPSETFVDAAQLPAAEILAGELVSVVARNPRATWKVGACPSMP